MIPDESQLQFCIMDDEGIVDGNGGLAIGGEESAAWERAIGLDEDWAIDRAKKNGMRVRRCAIMVINQ